MKWNLREIVFDVVIKIAQLVSWKYTFVIFLGSITPVVSNLIARMYPDFYLLFMENGDEET